MKKSETKVMIQMCEVCYRESDTENINVLEKKIAKRKCSFCGKVCCDNCLKKLSWTSNNTAPHFCPECRQFIETTKGSDLKKLGFECKYDSLTDEKSIEQAISDIEEQYRLKGVEAVQKFCKDLYQQGQKRIEAKRISEEKKQQLEYEISQNKNKIAEAERALKEKEYEIHPF